MVACKMMMACKMVMACQIVNRIIRTHHFMDSLVHGHAHESPNMTSDLPVLLDFQENR